MSNGPADFCLAKAKVRKTSSREGVSVSIAFAYEKFFGKSVPLRLTKPSRHGSYYQIVGRETQIQFKEIES
jgi:hypothetical protein